MKALVKISWSEETPILKFATPEGYETVKLEKGKEFDYEVTNKRRCIGFHSEKGEMTPCPAFNKIESGDQCFNCRKKDIYTHWRTGNGSPGFEADYSVYLAQCGNRVKVGVTRTDRLRNRWLEQGADYAVELFSKLSPEEALEKEKDLSEKGLKERIRKEHKILTSEKSVLEDKMEEYGLEGDIVDLSNSINCSSFVREGVFPSPVENVKGQIISNGRICLGISSGKVVQKSQQKGLSDF